MTLSGHIPDHIPGHIPGPTPGRISGSTRVFLILGDPVAQVRAPELFNHLFARHGADAVLVPAQVAAGDLAGFVRHVLKARNIDGLWLAIPHKTAMVDLLDRCDRLGRSAGAVNAVRRDADGTLEGALFDGVGFTKALAHFGLPAAGRSALVVGVGGGGVAIATSLAAAGASRIALFDTAPGRAAAMAGRLAGEFGVDVVSLARPDPAGFALVVNATPLGLRPDDPLPFDTARTDAGAVVVDILMKNQPTPLLRACRARGIVAHPGFEMLVQQVPEYLSFFGFDRIAQAVQDDASELRALFGAP
ncbi:shikimate dehydrogenase [Rhizobacter sp. SG703]|uniref:shikimate dehydrogenase family protein n=1 Tax=Rhizobacter sp. SG703 TaxID=2587140 RepID=UPI001447BEE6|nr:shikimate dehydrogenase [Rhizobacter sp. SG703]NKI95230.1 shikimate dehydrogenase [Rhizobacter sp. SG703]